MASGNRPKRHHFVPQGYLRGFANANGRITAVPLDHSRPSFTTSVKNVAAINNFHTVPEVAEPDSFEKVLSGIEGDAFNIVHRIENGDLPLSEQDRTTLSFYLALQVVRGPDTRKTIEHLKAKMIRLEVGAGGRENVRRWIKANMGFDATEEQAQRVWDEATQPGGPPITIRTGYHIKHAIDTAEHLTNYLLTRPWTIVRFDRRSLITCDAPVGLIRNPRDDSSPGIGFATAWGITVPLGRKIGLLMSDPMVVIDELNLDDTDIQKMRAAVVSGRADRVQAGTTALERLFNEHTAGGAREYIFCHPDDVKFIPANLHEPTLINIEAHGLADAEFDGKPWFHSDVEVEL